ncbi:hypothetical protein [Bacillus sp. FJAT-45350]|uniref:hypothetical protein n=1 Tax=Bacillus sp. FJAT-45350 TaxID=2011014 RepID=UPI0015CD26B2|nr:hypothetical protein [Bacillus sp. FJAT-45350]
MSKDEETKNYEEILLQEKDDCSLQNVSFAPGENKYLNEYSQVDKKDNLEG